MQVDRVAEHSPTRRRSDVSVGDPDGSPRREGDRRPDVDFSRLCESHVCCARSFPVDFKLQRVSVAVRNVRAAGGNAVAPVREVDLFHFAELDVDAALSDLPAAHAGEVRLTAQLQREATIHQVVPRVPLGNTGSVHRGNEIANAFRSAHADFEGSATGHVGHGEVWQLVGGSAEARDQFPFGERAIAVLIHFLKRFRHQEL